LETALTLTSWITGRFPAHESVVHRLPSSRLTVNHWQASPMPS
jgi:hypothetical protein